MSVSFNIWKNLPSVLTCLIILLYLWGDFGIFSLEIRVDGSDLPNLVFDTRGLYFLQAYLRYFSRLWTLILLWIKCCLDIWQFIWRLKGLKPLLPYYLLNFQFVDIYFTNFETKSSQISVFLGAESIFALGLLQNLKFYLIEVPGGHTSRLHFILHTWRYGQ